jgi:hypothetical protein
VDVNQHLADVDAALDRVGELPVIGSADIMGRSDDGDYSHWYAYSAKGFYAYDWRAGTVPTSACRHRPFLSASVSSL